MIRKIAIILEMIKFEHTIFVLPFAYLGSLLGSIEVYHHLPTWSQIGWITLAMVGARSAAMALNRLIDRQIDAKNPRTRGRAIPEGKIGIPMVWVFTIFSLFLLFISTTQLNSLVVKLCPIAVFFLLIYSYTKRFTWACHFFLGVATALGPIGGWLATTGSFNAKAFLLFGIVACWISGFDIIYACQDVEFDRKEKLHSIPARFGVGPALLISSFLHVGTAAGLILLFFLSHLNVWFGIGIVFGILILLYEHMIISKDDLSRLDTAFFTMNGMISILLFVFALMGVL